MPKFGVFWGVMGHPRSSETQPFDTAHTTSYSTLIETMRLSCTIFELQRVLQSKVTNFNPPHLHLSSPQGVIPFEFRSELWCQKTRIKGLSCGVICAILHLALLIQYRSVTETHAQTHRHTTTAYTALSMTVAR